LISRVAARSYVLHGLHLAVSGWGEAVDALGSRLARLPAGSGDEPDLELEIAAGNAALPGAAARGRPVYDPPDGAVLYDDEADRLHLELGPRLRAVCAPARGWARLACVGGDGAIGGDLWTLSHPLATLPLVELLKRRGLYSVHAAGLCRNGRGLVLPGTSGAGKSTLTLALARAGFGLLGDDTLFLARRPEGLRLLAFPDEIDLTLETLAFFPELVPYLAAPRPGWRKRQLRPEDAYGAEVVWECAPGHLVFPRVAGTSESRLIPLDAGEALFELVPNVLLTEPVSSQAHLDALAGLAAGSACWRLETGRDLDGAVRLLAGLFPAGLSDRTDRSDPSDRSDPTGRRGGVEKAP
jgi:hypothetical protein